MPLDKLTGAVMKREIDRSELVRKYNENHGSDGKFSSGGDAPKGAVGRVSEKLKDMLLPPDWRYVQSRTPNLANTIRDMLGRPMKPEKGKK